MSHHTSTRGALASLCLATLLPTLATSIANIALPELAQAFNAPLQAVQWVVLAYLLGITTLIVGLGRLGDMHGRKKVLLIGLTLFTVASVFCALAPGLHWLVAARTLQGVGAATLLALGMAFVREVTPPRQTGRAMGLLGTTSAIGTALGPSLGGLVIDHWGWRVIFWMMVPLAVINLGLVWRYLPTPTPAPPENRYDFRGTAALGVSLAAYALAMTQAHLHATLLLLSVAAVSAALFFRRQGRSPWPLIPLTVFEQVGFKASLLMSALVATVMMSTLIVSPFFFSISLNLSTRATGLIMAIGPIVAALSGVPAGRITDHLGAAMSSRIGLIVMVLGGIGLTFLPQHFGAAGYVAAIAVLTPGYQLFLAANNTNVMSQVSPEQRGLISAILNLCRHLGLITGASVMASLFALAAGTHQITRAAPAAVHHATQVTFAVATGLLCLAFLVTLTRNANSQANGS